jgi:hypothetical protein
MPQLYANPYDTSATGFYFESLDEFKKKAKASREPVILTASDVAERLAADLRKMLGKEK